MVLQIPKFPSKYQNFSAVKFSVVNITITLFIFIGLTGIFMRVQEVG